MTGLIFVFKPMQLSQPHKGKNHNNNDTRKMKVLLPRKNMTVVMVFVTFNLEVKNNQRGRMDYTGYPRRRTKFS